VQHTDDDLLTDIAALGQADRAVLDARLQRNRVVGHVDAEAGTTRLHTADLHGVSVHEDTTGREQAR
jgi:hypothetical protein